MLTQEEVINNLTNRWYNFDFSKFKYINSKTKGIVICPIHGEFESIYNRMMNKNLKTICMKCANENKLAINNNNMDKINNLKNKFPNLNFNNFKYINSKTNSTIVCAIHGKFKSSYIRLMNNKNKYGCPKCNISNKDKRIINTSMDKDIAIQSMQAKFPELDFSKFIYVNDKAKSIIICKKHGEMEMSRHRVMSKGMIYPCKLCRAKNNKYKEEVINNLKNKWKELNFDNFEYIKSSNKSIVVCSKHGEFESSYKRLMARDNKYGCPTCAKENRKVLKCNISSYEKEIIEYIKSINPSLNIELNNRSIILNEYTNNYLELDIYLPDINLAIEFNGSYWHSDKVISRTRKGFKTAKEYHDYKTLKCEEKGIKLIHIEEHMYKKIKVDILNELKRKIIAT